MGKTMETKKLYTRDNEPTEELRKIVTKKYKNVVLTYEVVYFLDYEVDENTGYIKENKVEYYTKDQYVRNIESLKRAIFEYNKNVIKKNENGKDN